MANSTQSTAEQLHPPTTAGAESGSGSSLTIYALQGEVGKISLLETVKSPVAIETDDSNLKSKNFTGEPDLPLTAVEQIEDPYKESPYYNSKKAKSLSAAQLLELRNE